MTSYYNTLFPANSSIKNIYLIYSQAQAVNALPLSSMAPNMYLSIITLSVPNHTTQSHDYVGHSVEQIPTRDKNLQKLHHLLLSAQHALMNPAHLK